MEDWSLNELVVTIASHPRMFAPDGSFEIAASFINGFVAGRGEAMYNELDSFAEWLARQCYDLYGWPRNHVWSWYIQQIAGDGDAFAEMRRLFECFQKGIALSAAPPD